MSLPAALERALLAHCYRLPLGGVGSPTSTAWLGLVGKRGRGRGLQAKGTWDWTGRTWDGPMPWELKAVTELSGGLIPHLPPAARCQMQMLPAAVAVAVDTD